MNLFRYLQGNHGKSDDIVWLEEFEGFEKFEWFELFEMFGGRPPLVGAWHMWPPNVGTTYIHRVRIIVFMVFVPQTFSRTLIFNS